MREMKGRMMRRRRWRVGGVSVAADQMIHDKWAQCSDLWVTQEDNGRRGRWQNEMEQEKREGVWLEEKDGKITEKSERSWEVIVDINVGQLLQFGGRTGRSSSSWWTACPRSWMRRIQNNFRLPPSRADRMSVALCLLGTPSPTVRAAAAAAAALRRLTWPQLPGPEENLEHRVKDEEPAQPGKENSFHNED